MPGSYRPTYTVDVNTFSTEATSTGYYINITNRRPLDDWGGWLIDPGHGAYTATQTVITYPQIPRSSSWRHHDKEPSEEDRATLLKLING